MNPYFQSFIDNARLIAASKGVKWEINIAESGICFPGQGWNLTEMVQAQAPPLCWLKDWGTDKNTLQVLNSLPEPGPQRTYSKKAISNHWQDLIKACVIDQLFVRKNTPENASNSVARPLRVLATCVQKDEPWTITADDVKFAFNTAKKLSRSGKLADLVFGVVRTILDPNHLVDLGPISPALTREMKSGMRASKFGKSLDELRSDLEERKHEEKLPEKRAFWELVRIAFTEKPKTFLDVLRFAQVKTLVITGLRVGESALIPADWKRQKKYFDVNHQPAEVGGGFSHSLMLRHFAEKQRMAYEDSSALFEAVQHVPPMFEAILAGTLDQIVALTAPLRATLKRQIETGRILPQFALGRMVPIVELYPILTGNPLVVAMPKDLEDRYISAYNSTFDPQVLEDLAAYTRNSGSRLLKQTVYQYLNRFEGAPLRKRDGTVWEGRRDWDSIFLRIDEVEEHLSRDLPTKNSDTAPLKLAGGWLGAWELLFLMPKRSLSEGLGRGICDVTRYYSVGHMDPQMLNGALDHPVNGLFRRYGQSDSDRELSLNPHSLRHLQNTELFRLGIADTIITKRFNRRSVAQSYEYDHRSLAEELERIELKPDVELRLGDKAATVARLIKAGKARGPIVEAFERIQRKQGEDAAFDYLRAEADGFHSTPYGACINSFTVDPCPKHLECFSGCRHLSATDLPENRRNLVQLQTRLEAAVQEIEGRPSKSIGRDNQLTHATIRLEGVKKLLGTAPGQPVFPDGPDLSRDTSNRRSVLDDVKPVDDTSSSRKMNVAVNGKGIATNDSDFTPGSVTRSNLGQGGIRTPRRRVQND